MRTEVDGSFKNNLEQSRSSILALKKSSWTSLNALAFCLNICLVVPGLSFGTQDLRSSLWYVGSLAAACKFLGIQFLDQESNPGLLP